MLKVTWPEYSPSDPILCEAVLSPVLTPIMLQQILWRKEIIITASKYVYKKKKYEVRNVWQIIDKMDKAVYKIMDSIK